MIMGHYVKWKHMSKWGAAPSDNYNFNHIRKADRNTTEGSITAYGSQLHKCTVAQYNGDKRIFII